MSTTTRRRALRVGTVLGVAATIALATADGHFTHPVVASHRAGFV
jgi:hypothetical protein